MPKGMKYCQNKSCGASNGPRALSCTTCGTVFEKVGPYIPKKKRKQEDQNNPAPTLETTSEASRFIYTPFRHHYNDKPNEYAIVPCPIRLKDLTVESVLNFVNELKNRTITVGVDRYQFSLDSAIIYAIDFIKPNTNEEKQSIKDKITVAWEIAASQQF